ncbi:MULTISPECIES: phage tail protein [Enterobacter]|uniref:phage tail protein n=1 Tax=Enterobacter TaxID=547 RepID=UPI0010620E82|nr:MULTISPECIES: phage tail protein [Enterobacter]MBL5839796.1 phage tail protein [Enterobacter asburiae]MBL5940430.1 phage tail protein [Enterobacter asburiae]MBL5962633.1 phage tail protein [Enterobacter asburiae]MBL5970073.1 phage tail protein [Enterobacter asburiae]TDP19405.1 tail completion protein R (GpR) [Enterobacter sp. AG326]
MHKLKSLRQALIDAIPQLNANPERLQMSVGGGNIDARQASSLSFEKQYVLNAKVSGFTGDSEGFFVPVLAWLRENQPDIFTLDEGRKNGYTFAIVLNDDDTMDITISVQLTERILVSQEQGALHATYSPEPPLPEPVTRPKALYVNGELVSQWED